MYSTREMFLGRRVAVHYLQRKQLITQWNLPSKRFLCRRRGRTQRQIYIFTAASSELLYSFCSQTKSNDNLSHSASQSKVKWKGTGVGEGWGWEGTIGVSLATFVCLLTPNWHRNRFLPRESIKNMASRRLHLS